MEQLCHAILRAPPSQTSYDAVVMMVAWHSSCIPDHQPVCVLSHCNFIHRGLVWLYAVEQLCYVTVTALSSQITYDVKSCYWCLAQLRLS